MNIKTVPPVPAKDSYVIELSHDEAVMLGQIINTLEMESLPFDAEHFGMELLREMPDASIDQDTNFPLACLNTYPNKK